MLTVVAEFRSKPGREEDLRAALEACIAPTRAEQGCIQYVLHVSTEAPGHFLFYENWTSPEALERHLATPHLGRLRERLAELAEGEARVSRFARIG